MRIEVVNWNTGETLATDFENYLDFLKEIEKWSEDDLRIKLIGEKGETNDICKSLIEVYKYYSQNNLFKDNHKS